MFFSFSITFNTAGSVLGGAVRNFSTEIVFAFFAAAISDFLQLNKVSTNKIKNKGM